MRQIRIATADTRTPWQLRRSVGVVSLSSDETIHYLAGWNPITQYGEKSGYRNVSLR
jgi:hypothetical protein